MNYFEEFLQAHPFTTEHSFSAEELSDLEPKVPPIVLRLLSTVGRAHGFLRTQLPSENTPLLELWGIDPHKAHLFMTSALGLLAFATKTEIYVLDPHLGRVFDANNGLPDDLAFSMLFMDCVTFGSQLSERGLDQEALNTDEIWGIFPPLALGGTFGNAFGGVATVTFDRVPSAEHARYLASLKGHKAKGLPASLKLAKNRAPLPPRAAKEATVQFDGGLHFAVVSALFGSGNITRETIHAALAPVLELEGEEWQRTQKAVQLLRQVRLEDSFLLQVKALERNLEFETMFETMIGVETGGEDDYFAITSLRGIENLPALERLDLASLTFDTTKPPSLTPLAGHPTLTELSLGEPTCKKLELLLKIPNLRRVTIPTAVKLSPRLAATFEGAGVSLLRY